MIKLLNSAWHILDTFTLIYGGILLIAVISSCAIVLLFRLMIYFLKLGDQWAKNQQKASAKRMEITKARIEQLNKNL